MWFTVLQLLSVYPEEDPDEEPEEEPEPEFTFTCWLLAEPELDPGPKAPEKVNIPDPEVPVELC